jgi:hypothetical protein
MDTWEVTKAVFDRVHALDPDNASKIVGMLLIHDNSDKEMIRLAFGPDHHLNSVVARARAELAATPSSPMLGPFQMGCDGGDALYPDEYDCWSPASGAHRRSFSPSDAEVAAWQPCMYYARGFCKNGSSCRFPHVAPEEDAAMAEREMAAMQRAKAMAARPPQLMEPAFPFSPSPKGLNFIFPHQQLGEAQRCRLCRPRLHFCSCFLFRV